MFGSPFLQWVNSCFIFSLPSVSFLLIMVYISQILYCWDDHCHENNLVAKKPSQLKVVATNFGNSHRLM